MLTLEELRHDVESGLIDTVVVAFTDMQGRLMGKRVHAEFFLDDSLEHGVEACNYLLALDMEMEPRPGLRADELGHRLRRLPADARPEHAAAHPVARGDGARPLRRLHGTTARRSRPRRGRC